MKIRIEPTLMASMLLLTGATLTAERFAAELQMPLVAAIARKDDSGISWSELTIARALLAGNVEGLAPETAPRPGHWPGTGS
jgi:hypothetical protein